MQSIEYVVTNNRKGNPGGVRLCVNRLLLFGVCLFQQLHSDRMQVLHSVRSRYFDQESENVAVLTQMFTNFCHYLPPATNPRL